ncbi:MAG: BrnT family toxin [Acidobacteria bacterium]|nr:BrnT family toxin [Acidobacteriota bacterium]
MEYEWDPEKARKNYRKHGVSFADAIAVLEDELAVTTEDPFPRSEDRFVSVGRDPFGEVLVVVFAWRGDRIRVISAREATPRERRQYEEG